MARHGDNYWLEQLATTGGSGTGAANITQLGGNAIATNSGNKSSGTQRVVIATDQPVLTNPQPVKGKLTEVALTPGSALNAVLYTGDVSDFRFYSLQLTGTFSATIQIQLSNDNVNWITTPAAISNVVSQSNTLVATVNSTGIYTGPIESRYIQFVISSYSSGTVTGTLELDTNMHINHTYGVAAQIVGTALVNDIGAGSTASAQVSVGTSTTQLVAARTNRKALVIVNHGTTDVFVGPTAVTTGGGVLLAGVKGTSLTIPTSARVDGIVASGSQTVSIIEIF